MPPYDTPDTAAIIARALAEDLAERGDLTVAALVPADAEQGVTITAKEDGVVCGLPLFLHVCEQLAPGTVQVSEVTEDGRAVRAGDVVLTGQGLASTILIAERTALNLAQRLSGVATTAARYAAAVAGTGARVLDTRKTTPGLRLLEKHAVRVGGCHNHRVGLYDQVLIKENHIALMQQGGPAEAVQRCREHHGRDAVIEVEIEALSDLAGVLAAGADIVLLDNFPTADLAAAVAQRGEHRAQLEASGGITLDTIRSVAETGVDRISVGALTHSVRALDLSLRCH